MNRLDHKNHKDNEHGLIEGKFTLGIYLDTECEVSEYHFKYLFYFAVKGNAHRIYF